ncbi:MAG: energy-coupling factor ABC transporter permease [Clostridia bacterium]|nr:energy-coupling factor ABC transporter permease [Clostridia bacterium]
MHLMDGTLPVVHSAVYAAVSGVFILKGMRDYYKNSIGKPEYKIICGAFGAFIFTATFFEIPMPFGSSEHPTGTPLVSIFLGPFVTCLISLAVLILELLFREGGFLTLGANVFSLGIVGAFTGFGVFHFAKKVKIGLAPAAFLAGFLGDLSVYVSTAFQLGLGNQAKHSVLYYLLSFMPGQLPLAVVEGIFTALVLGFIYKRRPALLEKYKVTA